MLGHTNHTSRLPSTHQPPHPTMQAYMHLNFNFLNNHHACALHTRHALSTTCNPLFQTILCMPTCIHTSKLPYNSRLYIQYLLLLLTSLTHLPPLPLPRSCFPSLLSRFLPSPAPPRPCPYLQQLHPPVFNLLTSPDLSNFLSNNPPLRSILYLLTASYAPCFSVFENTSVITTPTHHTCSQQQKAKTTTPRIPMWSPTMVLTKRC